MCRAAATEFHDLYGKVYLAGDSPAPFPRRECGVDPDSGVGQSRWIQRGFARKGDAEPTAAWWRHPTPPLFHVLHPRPLPFWMPPVTG